MPVTKRDLPNIQGRRLDSGAYIEPTRPVLYCRTCGDTYSASPGDYWAADATKPLTCDGCGGLLELARRLIQYVPWEQGEAIRAMVRDTVRWPDATNGKDKGGE